MTSAGARHLHPPRRLPLPVRRDRRDRRALDRGVPQAGVIRPTPRRSVVEPRDVGVRAGVARGRVPRGLGSTGRALAGRAARPRRHRGRRSGRPANAARRPITGGPRLARYLSKLAGKGSELDLRVVGTTVNGRAGPRPRWVARPCWSSRSGSKAAASATSGPWSTRRSSCPGTPMRRARPRSDPATTPRHVTLRPRPAATEATTPGLHLTPGRPRSCCTTRRRPPGPHPPTKAGAPTAARSTSIGSSHAQEARCGAGPNGSRGSGRHGMWRCHHYDAHSLDHSAGLASTWSEPMNPMRLTLRSTGARADHRHRAIALVTGVVMVMVAAAGTPEPARSQGAARRPSARSPGPW